MVGGGGAWVISLSGRCGALASCSPALVVAKMSRTVGEVGGAWCQRAAREVVTRRVIGFLLFGDGGGGIVLRCPSLWVVRQGLEAGGAVMFPAVKSKERVEPVSGGQWLVEAASSRKVSMVP